jgi:hypothetical protein
MSFKVAGHHLHLQANLDLAQVQQVGDKLIHVSRSYFDPSHKLTLLSIEGSHFFQQVYVALNYAQGRLQVMETEVVTAQPVLARPHSRIRLSGWDRSEPALSLRQSHQ